MKLAKLFSKLYTQSELMSFKWDWQMFWCVKYIVIFSTGAEEWRFYNNIISSNITNHDRNKKKQNKILFFIKIASFSNWKKKQKIKNKIRVDSWLISWTSFIKTHWQLVRWMKLLVFFFESKNRCWKLLVFHSSLLLTTNFWILSILLRS